jgi:hypothetical protein
MQSAKIKNPPKTKKKDIHESTNKKKKDEKEQSNIVWTKNMYIYI